MATKVATALAGVHPQMLRVGIEPDRKKVAEAYREEIGRDVERVFGLLGITKQEAAYRMGYTDAGTVSRWCAATERPQFDKLFAIDGFEDGWMLIRARRNPLIKVRTVLEFEDRKTA